MRQIREGVFETNSSSTHSISFPKGAECKMGRLPLNTRGNVEIECREFGWEVRDYTDPSSKASYAAIYVRDWTSGKNKKLFREVLVDVIKDQTGCNEVEFDFDLVGPDCLPYFERGYIDHQSVEKGQLDHMFKHPKLLRKFIFNSSVVLHTDNDNRY